MSPQDKKPPAPYYYQNNKSNLYAAQANETDKGWYGYLITYEHKKTPPNPPSITLNDSFFENSGTYLISLTAPLLTTAEETQAFIKKIKQFLDNTYGLQPNKKFNGRAIVWFDETAQQLDSSNTASFTFNRHKPGPEAPRFISSNFNGHVSSNLTFSISKQCQIKLIEQCMVISESGPGSVDLVTSPVNHGPSVSPNQTKIPFFGANRGSFLLEGELNTSETIDFLEGGLHFAHGTQNDSNDDQNTENNAADVVQQYPVIDLQKPGTDVKYHGVIDILDPINAYLTDNQIANGQLHTCFALEQKSLTSWLRTASGRNIELVPLGSLDEYGAPVPFSASLVLEDKATGPEDRYLSFAGDFALQIDGEQLSKNGAGASHEFLCGLFGTEVLSFRSYAKDAPFDVLRFVPRQSAYAPVFPFEAASLEDPNSGKTGSRLSNKYLTSWATIIPGEDAQAFYLAQPQGSPLYKPSSAVAQGMLDFFPTRAPIPAKPGFAIPLVPYAGISNEQGFAPEDLGIFESQILSPTRKTLIGEHTRKQLKAKRIAKTDAKEAPALKLETAATPQGLLAQIVKDSAPTDYQKITLALSAPAPGRPQEMAFLQPEPELQGLFMTNQLFAVATNPEKLGTLIGSQQTFNISKQSLENLKADNVPDNILTKLDTIKDTPVIGENNFIKLLKKTLGEQDASQYQSLILALTLSPPPAPAFQNTVTIEDWTMTADVGARSGETDYRNVMIFKFCDGPLTERIANPNKWVDTDDFSVLANPSSPPLALTGLSQWLQNYVSDAQEQANQNNVLYKNFVEIIEDQHWQGILVLRASVDPSDIPDQLRGLAAGIDFSEFEAHHFGVTVSRVKVNSAGKVEADGPSSLFGLIDYVLPAYQRNLSGGGNPNIPLPLPVDDKYAFTVLQLQVLFENSAMVDFRSHIQLSTERLFDSAVSETYGVFGKSPSNAVVLKGSYQKQGNTSSYIFQQNKATLYGLNSNIFNAMAFDRVQFNTLNDGNGADGIVRSRFLIWGRFNFVSLPDSLSQKDAPAEPFDVLSFGGENEPLSASSISEGLAFSNLQIDIQSPLATPNSLTFSFDANNLAFDTAASNPREGSLFKTLALNVEDFIAAPADKTPADYGFLPVSMNVPMQALSGPWYGVVYKVTMGTAGSLAEKAGFDSELLLAWSAQTEKSAEQYAVFNGIKLPGAAPGAKLISLQGVLKVSVGSIELIHEPMGDTKNKSFNLKLNDIALKFLGIVKLPPGATINFFLFGDPSGDGSLGWYAAYIKDEKQPATLKALNELKPESSKTLTEKTT